MNLSKDDPQKTIYSTFITPLQFTLLITFIDFPIFTAYFLLLTGIILDQILLRVNLCSRRRRRGNVVDSETPLLSPPSSTTSLLSFNLTTNGYSTHFITLAGFLALLAPLLGLLEIYELPWDIGRMLGWSGVFLIIFGYSFRMYSLRDKWSTRTVVVADGLMVIGTGPYRYIRHPAYTGQIIAWLGFALSSGNLLVIFTIMSMICLAYWNQIRVEEEIMVEKFGDEYREYQRSTKKLIPFIY
ncbi:12303_t:CDS:2 [Ambispora leptoticha]|uniref:12303_t:CDS:1 n=1 Tax=Ambispora leptoticha TaxID=144679 RepID=A0A9N9C117_9GLOM|nr:12303_t:CDS:2 [Ambispora leptoticha]